MAISDVLRKAHAAVVEAEIPEDLREVAFRVAAEIAAREYGPTTPLSEPVQVGSNEHRAETILGRISQKLGIDIEQLEEVYAESEGGVILVVPSAKLERANAAASKQIALLLATARQSAGLEDWTSQDQIREVARDFGRLDSANFASAISEMTAEFVMKGKGQKRELKVNRTGIERAKQLISQLTNGND